MFRYILLFLVLFSNSSYSAGNLVPDNRFVQPDSGATPTTVDQKLKGGSIDVVPDFCNAGDVNNNTDNTSCVQAAITAAGNRGGAVVHMRGHFVVSNLSWPNGKNGIYVRGDGSAEGYDGGTQIRLSAGSSDAIQIGNFAGGGIENIYIDASARTGGYTFSHNGSQRFITRNVRIEHPYLCLRYYWINSDALDNVICDNVRGNGSAIEWAGDSTKRSDILTLKDVVVQGATNSDGTLANGATALHLIGNVNTLVINGFRAIKTVYGVLTEADSTSTVPIILKINDIDVDFSQYEALRLLAGGEFHITNGYFNGSGTTTNLVTIAQPTNEVMITNSKFSSANSSLFDISGQGVAIANNSLHNWAVTNNSQSAIHLESSAVMINIESNFGGTFGTYTIPSSALNLKIESGANYVNFVGNTFKGGAGMSNLSSGTINNVSNINN